MALRATWTDGKDQFALSQQQLESIGIGISECSKCKEIHQLAKLNRENNGLWIVITRADSIIEHINAIKGIGFCPKRQSGSQNVGTIDEPI